MATAGKATSQMDQRAKVKLIAASAVLLVAIVWIIYYATSMGGPAKGGPTLSASEQAAMEETHAKELEKVKEQTNEGYRGKKPPAPPSGS